MKAPFVRQFVAIVGILAGVSGARANTISIVNPSFETPSTSSFVLAPTSAGVGWTFSSSSASGIYHPVTPTQYATAAQFDGTQVAFVQATTAATISQTLSDSLLPNTVYTLSLLVGNRDDFSSNTGASSPSSTFSFSLFAGATLLAQLNKGDLGVTNPTHGTFAAETLSYTTGSSVAFGAIRIVLGANVHSGGEYDFDKVALDASPVASPAADPVPLPSAAWMGASLLGVIASAGLWRRKRRHHSI